jgi:hypothetical protein
MGQAAHVLTLDELISTPSYITAEVLPGSATISTSAAADSSVVSAALGRGGPAATHAPPAAQVAGPAAVPRQPRLSILAQPKSGRMSILAPHTSSAVNASGVTGRVSTILRKGEGRGGMPATARASMYVATATAAGTGGSSLSSSSVAGSSMLSRSSATSYGRLSMSAAPGAARGSLRYTGGQLFGGAAGRRTSIAPPSANASIGGESASGPASANLTAVSSSSTMLAGGSGVAAVFDKNLSHLLASAVAEAGLAAASGDTAGALRVYADLAADVPAVCSKALYWLSVSRLHEDGPGRDYVAAMDALAEGAAACRQHPVEHDCVRQAISRLAHALTALPTTSTAAKETLGMAKAKAAPAAAASAVALTAPAAEGGEVGSTLSSPELSAGGVAPAVMRAGLAAQPTDAFAQIVGDDTQIDAVGSSSVSEAPLRSHEDAVATSASMTPSVSAAGLADPDESPAGTPPPAAAQAAMTLALAMSTRRHTATVARGGAATSTAYYVASLDDEDEEDERREHAIYATLQGRLAEGVGTKSVARPLVGAAAAASSHEGPRVLDAAFAEACTLAASSGAASSDDEEADGSGSPDIVRRAHAVFAAVSAKKSALPPRPPAFDATAPVATFAAEQAPEESADEAGAELPAPSPGPGPSVQSQSSPGLALGSVVVLQTLSAKPSQARDLGSDVFLSPVRRSVRVHTTSVLKSARRQLLPPGGATATALGATTCAARKSEVETACSASPPHEAVHGLTMPAGSPVASAAGIGSGGSPRHTAIIALAAQPPAGSSPPATLATAASRPASPAALPLSIALEAAFGKSRGLGVGPVSDPAAISKGLAFGKLLADDAAVERALLAAVPVPHATLEEAGWAWVPNPALPDVTLLKGHMYGGLSGHAAAHDE